MARQERLVNTYQGYRDQVSGNSWHASIFGGTATILDTGIYLISDNGTADYPYVRINRDGLYMKDTDIELFKGSISISGGTFSIYGMPNGLTSNTFGVMENIGISAFKDGANTFYVDFRTGDAFFAGTISAFAGNIGTWDIYPDGLSATVSGYTILASPTQGINYNNNFFVTPEGNVTALNAVLSGSISADSGYLNNLSVIGTLTGGSYWYDPNHYINLNGSLTAINFGDKFVVLSGGDMYASNITITGNVNASYLFSNSGSIGNWIIGPDSLYQINALDDGTSASVYLSTATADPSSIYPSGRAEGLQIFNDGGINFYYDITVGKNLIKTNDVCGLSAETGNFENRTIVRDPNRVGYQFAFGTGQETPEVPFEMSVSSNYNGVIQWPYVKLQIAGFKFDTHGLSSCNNDFIISTDKDNPSLLIGSSTARVLHLGVSANNPYFNLTSTGNTINMFGDNVTMVINSLTSNRSYFNGYFFINDPATASTLYIKDYSLTAHSHPLEFVTKMWVDVQIRNAISASITAGIIGAGTVNRIAKFDGENSIANSIMSEYFFADSDPLNTISITGNLSANRGFANFSTPIFDNEWVTKSYVEELTTGGYFTRLNGNIYPSTLSDHLLIGLSGITGDLTAYNVAVSGTQYISQRLDVGSTISASSSLTSHSLYVDGTSYINGSLTTGRTSLSDPSLTSSPGFLEFITRGYVDSITINGGTPNYIPKYDSIGSNIEDSIMYYSSSENSIVVNGTIAAEQKNFNIKHPTYINSKENVRLVHASVETNKNDVYYRGHSKINNFKDEIILPYWFRDLCLNKDITIHITPWGPAKIYPIGVNFIFNKIEIESDYKDIEYDWIVYGVRKDVNELIPEQIK